jgi:hypothetical protein
MVAAAALAAVRQWMRRPYVGVDRGGTESRLLRTVCRLLAGMLVATGVWMIATASHWGPPAVALFGNEGILPQFSTSVPFWPLIPIALAAWLWTKGGG